MILSGAHVLFFTFLLCGFASAVANRTLDPLTLAVAQDFNVTAATAALLASASFLPYALVQPVLGPIGDHFGKTRVIKIALACTVVATFATAFAPVFAALILARVASGAAAGGIIPVTQALIGDLVKPADRQLTIARFNMSMIIGQMLGAAFAGMLEAWIGWRMAMALCGGVTLAAALMAFSFLPAPPPKRAQTFTIAGAISNYRTILRNPRSWACYITTPIIGGLTFGILPFIAPILDAQKNGGTREAGFIIAGLAGGSLIMPLVLPYLLKRMSRPVMMAAGGLIAGVSLVLFAQGWHWSVLIALFAGYGFGFFMVQNCVQYEVSELSQEFRGSAYSLHAFCFFMGQFAGPLVYGKIIPAFGAPGAIYFAAIMMAATGALTGLYFARVPARG
ncbi:MAG: MFS transporter [Alphaproteobacteria bacterium]|nr:MFS transporter [Alphaproteobacteria bacterium]